MMPSSRVVFWSMALLSFHSVQLWVQIFRYVSSTEEEEFLENHFETTTEEMPSNVSKHNRTTELKFILIWPKKKVYPFDILGEGQGAFIKHNCSYQNCYVSQNRELLGGIITRFHAIAFNGVRLKARDLPRERSPNQKYIFFSTESADNHPVCPAVFDNFFNWTTTYRLDSDIVFYYLLVRDKNNNTIGPKIDMNWETNKTDERYTPDRYSNKTKAVAWFVSNCRARSKRQELVEALQKALGNYGYTVDIYGRCGNMECPKKNITLCDKLLRNEYYFYFAAENSFCEDYLTEKVTTALRNDAVPIVYGGADYYRFLPPHSFIDARRFDPDELAAYLVKLINCPKDYRKYFRWKQHYTYVRYPSVGYICSICEALNNEALVKKHSVYVDFRKWWNPNYKQRCK